MEKVFRSTLGEDAWQRHLGHEQNYKEDCERFAALPDAALAEEVQKFLKQCQPPQWPRGAPVYDAVMWHTLIPEMIRRLRD